MSGAVIMAYDPTKVVDGAQVTVVTGSQFAVDSPAPPTTGNTSSTSTTTTAVSSSVPNGSIAALNPTVTNLEPWDPTSCTPGATAVAPTRIPLDVARFVRRPDERGHPSDPC